MIRADVIGQVFGRLTVVAIRRLPVGKIDRTMASVKCDCGAEKTVKLDLLKRGKTRSCGCLQKELASARRTTHGLSSHPLHVVWVGMIGRCHNKGNSKFKQYGERGISVCGEWRNDFQSFYDFSIKNGWHFGLQIDRIDNNGNYQPSNCRFVTCKENMANTRLLRSTNKTGFRGVSKRRGMFVVSVNISGHRYSKSGFGSAIDAAIHRDQYCINRKIKCPLNFVKVANIAARGIGRE